MEVTTGTGGKVTARSTCTDAVIQRLASQPGGGLGGTCRERPDDGLGDVFAAGDVVAVGDPDSAGDPGGPADGGKPDAPADAGVPDASRWPISGTAELHAATASAAASTPAVTGIACPAGRCIVTSIAQSRPRPGYPPPRATGLRRRGPPGLAGKDAGLCHRGPPVRRPGRSPASKHAVPPKPRQADGEAGT